MGIFEQAAVAQVGRMAAAIGSDYTAATFTPSGGSAVVVHVVINESTESVALLGDFGVSEPLPEGLFLKAENDPAKDGVLVVGARTWKVVDILDDDNHVVVVSLREIYS